MMLRNKNIEEQGSVRRTFDPKTIIKWLALLSLVVAYGIGHARREASELLKLRRHYPQATSFETISTKPLLFKVSHGEPGHVPHYLAVEKTHGYGGPVTVATEMDPSGIIRQIRVLDHKETPVFIKKIQENQFFDQFVGKDVSAAFELGQDIDAVTGATVSSASFCKAVQLGSQVIGKRVLDLPMKTERKKWHFGFKEGLLLVLYALISIGIVKKMTRLRYLTMAAGVVFLGFYLNSAISLSNIAVLFMGYLPPLREKLFWYLLVVGALLFIVAHGKNLYCFWLCPFGAIQELTAKIGGVNIRLSKRTLNYTQFISYTLTWAALMVIFLTDNSSLGSYEPFATLFGLEGFGVQWYILPAVILGSFTLKRFWCRFFCPVGVVLRLTTKARLSVKRLIKGNVEWPKKAN